MQLNTNRSLIKFILLNLITFGIYGLLAMSYISIDINLIASKYDGKHTTHFLLMAFVFSWLTLGITPFVWYHKLSSRIGYELLRRRIPYRFGAGSFWGWNILGALIGIGPLVYTHKFFTAMNLLSQIYNEED